jgi:DNA-binding IclR family transcriptional regulator
VDSERRSDILNDSTDIVPGPTRVLSSTLKSLRLLEAVATFDRAVGVSELVRQLGGSRGSVHLQLATLTQAGWLERVEGGRYRLTLRVLSVGHAALNQGGIGNWVVPIMEELARATDESISLSVIDGADAVIAWRVESSQVLRTDLRVGTRMSMQASASGRVLAAFADRVAVSHAAQAGAKLPDSCLIEAVQLQGWAESIDDFADGIAAVAAPVLDYRNHAIGALSIAGPSTRFIPSRAANAVCEAARALSSKLGDRRVGDRRDG